MKIELDPRRNSCAEVRFSTAGEHCNAATIHIGRLDQTMAAPAAHSLLVLFYFFDLSVLHGLFEARHTGASWQSRATRRRCSRQRSEAPARPASSVQRRIKLFACSSYSSQQQSMATSVTPGVASRRLGMNEPTVQGPWPDPIGCPVRRPVFGYGGRRAVLRIRSFAPTAVRLACLDGPWRWRRNRGSCEIWARVKGLASSRVPADSG